MLPGLPQLLWLDSPYLLKVRNSWGINPWAFSLIYSHPSSSLISPSPKASCITPPHADNAQVSTSADSSPSLQAPNTHSLLRIGSVAQSCLTLCDPMNRSTPGLPIHHQLPESTQTHVHGVRDAIQPSHPLSSPFPPSLNLSQHQGLFK